MGLSGRPLVGCKKEAAALKTALSTTAVVRLLKGGVIPLDTWIQADFAANETTYSGYASQTVAAWNNPVLAGVNAYAIFASSVLVFAWTAAGADPTDTVGGYWVEYADGTVSRWATLDQEVSMNGPDKVLPLTPVLAETTNG